MKQFFPYSVCNNYYYCWGQRSIRTYHSHYLSEIYYFHSGSGEYILGDTIIQLTPGDLIIMDGLTPHGPKFGSLQDEFIRTMFQFEPYAARLFEQQNGINLLRPFEELRNCKLHLEGEEKEEFEHILKRFNRFYRKKDIVNSGRFLMAFYDMLLIIYEKCQDRCTGTGASLTDKENMVRKVMDYVEQSFAEEITLDSLVKQFHVSKQYLSKIFREITGLTIMEYIYRRRINQAKILFYLEKENAVTDVCFKVGFKNLSHFSRKFKLQEGLPPEQYRRMVHRTG